MSFDSFELDPRIMRGIEDAGFQTPTPIQQKAIPEVLAGHDVLGLAQTGTGKTAAFVLPLLQQLTKGKLRKIRALIVAPTRELAEQIHVSAENLAQHTKIRSMTMYGGVGKGKQRQALQRGVEIIVACPGRFLDMQKEENIDLSTVEVLILDEADRMCDMGFLPDIKKIVKLLPAKRQTLFFSATMPQEIRKLSNSILKNPKTVQIGLIAPAKTVSHAIFQVPFETKTKRSLVFHLLETERIGRVLVFTRTKRRARTLAQRMTKMKYNVAALQGNMSQGARQKAIDGFRSGKFSILVATDIAARGIDVSEISHVINFDMPDTVDAYTHRIGRTGRAEQSGQAYTFVTPDDKDMLRRIERALKKPIERLEMPESFASPRPAKASQKPAQTNSEAKEGTKQPSTRKNNNKRRRRRNRGRQNSSTPKPAQNKNKPAKQHRVAKRG